MAEMKITFDQACAFVDMVKKGAPSGDAFQLLTGHFCPDQIDFITPFLPSRDTNRRLFISFLRGVATALADEINYVTKAEDSDDDAILTVIDTWEAHCPESLRIALDRTVRLARIGAEVEKERADVSKV